MTTSISSEIKSQIVSTVCLTFSFCSKGLLRKLDRYLPRGSKKDIVAKVIVTEINRPHSNKYEISVAMEIVGGKVIAAKDECSNVFAGIDILEAKLTGQIRRYKIETNPHLRKNPLPTPFSSW